MHHMSKFIVVWVAVSHSETQSRQCAKSI